MNEITKKWLTLQEVSRMCGESKPTIMRRISSGEIKAIQRAPRGRWLFHIDAVKRYCDRDYNADYQSYVDEVAK